VTSGGSDGGGQKFKRDLRVEKEREHVVSLWQYGYFTMGRE